MNARRLRLLVVMNPSAHDFEARRSWPLVRPLLERAADVVLVETVPDEATTIGRLRLELERGGFDRVVSIGGDGTAHVVTNAFGRLGLGRAPELAVIPFGTANNVAKSLGLPLDDLERLAAIAVSDKLSGYDVGRVRLEQGVLSHERFFCDCVGVGIDADVVAARGRWRDLRGYLGYVAALAERTVEQPSIDVTAEVDGRRLSGRFYNVVINNAPVYAGELVLPNGRCDDGLLDLYLLDRLEYGSKLVSFVVKQVDVLGLGVSEFLEGITENQRDFHGRRIAIELEAARHVQVDGELAPFEAKTIVCEIAGRIAVAVG